MLDALNSSQMFLVGVVYGIMALFAWRKLKNAPPVVRIVGVLLLAAAVAYVLLDQGTDYWDGPGWPGGNM